MRHRFGMLACVVIIAASCQSSTPSSAPPAATEPGSSPESSAAPDPNLAEEQILSVSIESEPDTLDPTNSAGSEVLRSLHRGLVDFDRDFNVVPALAESWDISEDAKTLTFHLRDAGYSNGDPIVAGDFVYSWRRLADPRNAAGYAYAIAEVVGGPELLAMGAADPAPSDAVIDAALRRLGVEAPDDKTFIVRLNTPATYFLSAMTLWVFVPLQERWITTANATEAGNYVSSGPFVLDAWVHDSQIVLKPNPNWWGAVKPTLTEIKMSILPQAQAQLAYEADEIDVVAPLDVEVQRIRSDPVLGAEYHEVTQPAINFYSFNNFQDPELASYANPGPTANQDFRIALTQAIDKQTLIDLTFAGLGQVANSVIMPGIPGYQPDLNPYPYDLDSARRHMDKALAALGVSSTPELGKLKIGYGLGFGREIQVAFLAEAWRQAFGLETALIGGEVLTFSAERSLGAFDVSFNGWLADYPHANNQLSGTFTCNGGNNHAQYCNPTFDALIAKAAAEPDQDKQVAIYNEAQTLLINDAPILPLRFIVTPYEVKPYVSGLTVTAGDFRTPGQSFYETVQILKH